MNERIKEWLILSIAFILAIFANLPEHLQSQLSIDKDHILFILVAMLAFSLVRYVKTMLVLTMTVLVFGANLPQTLADKYPLNVDILLAVLVLVVIIALVNRFFQFLPVDAKTVVLSNKQGARALYKAISLGKIAMVRRLVPAGTEINALRLYGQTPLIFAAAAGHAKIVEYLIKMGSQVNDLSDEGFTAEQIAIKHGHDEIGHYLRTLA